MLFLTHILFLLLFMVSRPALGGTIKGEVLYDGKPMEQAAVHLEGDLGSHGPPQAHGVVTQKKQRFFPEVLTVLKGTQVFFPNEDTVVHHAFSLSPPKVFDLGNYGPNKNPHVVFDRIGKVDIFCNKHRQMNASVIVLDHPFFSFTSSEGTYEIKDVPDGTYVIKAWAGSFTFEENNVVVQGSQPVRVDFLFNGDQKTMPKNKFGFGE